MLSAGTLVLQGRMQLVNAAVSVSRAQSALTKALGWEGGPAGLPPSRPTWQDWSSVVSTENAAESAGGGCGLGPHTWWVVLTWE